MGDGKSPNICMHHTQTIALCMLFLQTLQRCARQTILERQHLSWTYLAHHELESNFIVNIIMILIIIIIMLFLYYYYDDDDDAFLIKSGLCHQEHGQQ